MDKNIYIQIAGGLVILGLILILMDFCIVKFLKKIPADSLIKNKIEAFLENHGFRKGGLMVAGLGLLVFLFSTTFSPTNLGADFQTKVGDVLANFQRIQNVQTPWGRIDIAVTIILSLASGVLFFEGFWLRKKRPDMKVWLLAIILALIVLLEGIFQWN